MSDSKFSRKGIPRKPVNQIALECEKVPGFNDVYVEGAYDARIIKYYLKQHGRNCGVFPVDLVYIPPDELTKLNLDNGERGRVLALGAMLENTLPNPEYSMPTLIADLDRDAVLPPEAVVCKTCLFTDFTSMEMYGYKADVIEKLLESFLHTDKITATEIIRVIQPVLIDVFYIRAVLHMSNLKISLGDEFCGYCKFINSNIVIDRVGLVQNAFRDYNLKFRTPTSEILEKADELKLLAPTDPRLVIRGHDFFHLLSWVIQTKYHFNRQWQEVLLMDFSQCSRRMILT